MSSALTSSVGSGSSPQLQIDLVGLSNLMVSIGSRGLKQLATSGVAVHSLGCMLMIAEFTPASIEFRMTLNRVRERQRSERAWFFKVVEIGSGSNFLADQLLQTRAGTNVVALLSSIASVMNEDACSRVLSILFETSGVALDNTPGIGEFGKIREALLPVAYKTEFKEKVLQYQELLNNFMLEKSPDRNRNPYDAIPHDMDIAKIIQMLFKITSHENYTLTYTGTAGAGWLATYASYVLGLETCAIKDSGHVLPINGSYEHAKIIIRSPSSGVSSMCEISRAGNIEDFISLTAIGDLDRCAWSIDCTVVNFLDTHLPDLRKETIFPIICEAAVREMKEIVTELAQDFVNDNPLYKRKTPISTYTVSVLPYLRSRGLHSLKILGFDCNYSSNTTFELRSHRDPTCKYCIMEPMPISDYSISSADTDTIREYHTVRPQLHTVHVSRANHLQLPQEHASVVDSLYPQDGRWPSTHDLSTESKTSRLMSYLIYCSNHLQGKDRESNTHRLAFAGWPEALQHELCRTVIYAAHIAARLAFTDWDTSIKCLSVQVFRNPYLYARGSTFVSADAGFHGHLSSAVLLCTDAIDLSGLKMRVSDDWAAVDLDSTIVVRSTVAHQSLSGLRGCYFEFRKGRITYEAMTCTIIRVDRGENYVNGPFSFRYKDNMERSDIVQYCTTWGPRLNPGSIQGRDQIEFRYSWNKIYGTLTFKLECLVETNRWAPVDPIKISQAIPRLWATKPCPHPFENPLRIHGIGNAETKSSRLKIKEWVSIFASDPQPRSGRVANYGGLRTDVYYTHTDRNIESRWFSCMVDLDRSLALILQEETCLACTIHQIHVSCENQGWNRFYIIAGGYHDASSSDESESENVLWPCQQYQALSRLDWLRDKGSQKYRTKSDKCPGPVHTECCSSRTHEPCIVCVPFICRPEAACEGCQEIHSR